MNDELESLPERFVVRVIGRDREGEIVGVMEQEIPQTVDEIALFLRRRPARSQIACTLLEGGSIVIEIKR